MIITDLEGVSCVDSVDMMIADSVGYQFARKQLMLDVNAAIDGAFDGGADEVLVVDGHGTGQNFIPGMLDGRAKQLSAAEFIKCPLDGFDALMTIGCHAMAGCEKAFLDHTQNSRTWFEYTVGGKKYGEIGQQAIIAGVYNVPLVMISGDDSACKEAKILVSNIAVASVKTADVRNKANCIEVENALKKIYEAAFDGVKRYKQIKPYHIQTPTEISVTFVRNDYCDEIALKNSNLKRCGRTVVKTVDVIKCYGDIVKF